MPTNSEFLTALFAEDAAWTHVTDFKHDPDHIPPDQQLAVWRGNYFSRYTFGTETNQYFTISNFYADEKGCARRRKILFRHTRVVVLDDVRDKLPIEEVSKLPQPSWIMETSPGSEQWGYILTEPCTVRSRIENLLDGLVANGLAPDGKDPGMKGVTRYVRLPEGYNTKAKKFVDGKPFKCRLILWEPFNYVTLEQLAQPFNVDLDAVRREGRLDGATKIEDHPLLQLPDLIQIKDVRSDGRFDITCPWVDEHTNNIDNGAAVMTNGDGSFGFKCHHGSCQHRTGRHLLEFIEEQVPGFTQSFTHWKTVFSFREAVHTPTIPVPDKPHHTPAPPAKAPDPVETPEDVFNRALGQLRHLQPYSTDARTQASKLLFATDALPAIERHHWQDSVREHMGWTKPEFAKIIKSEREKWYARSASGTINFFDETIFISELNTFYDRNKNLFLQPEAFQNTYAHLAPDARKDALQGGLVTKVDKLGYAPLKPPIYQEGHVVYGNTWCDTTELQGIPGDINKYLDHFDLIGWGAHKKHLLQWMAFTLRHPDKKINHMIILASGEGVGKDWLLYPMMKALGNNSATIPGEELTSQFNEFVIGVKHVHINEVELGDHTEARMIANRIKQYAAAPPDELRVNSKSTKRFKVKNLLNLSMTSNSPVPLRIQTATRRMFSIWSDFNPRDENERMLPEWEQYWIDRWEWMQNGGAEAVIFYLRNWVDLSDFKPGSPPPVTEFLQEMREASMSPAHQTVMAFIQQKIGAFQCDLLTATDMVDTLKKGLTFAPDACFVPDPSWFTPVRVGVIMRELAHVQRRGQHGPTSANLWIIRNRTDYLLMTSTELYESYLVQMQLLKSTARIHAVK